MADTRLRRLAASSRIRFIPVWYLSLVIALGWTTGASSVYAQDLAIGAGFKAGFTCSAVFQGGRSPLDVSREELQGVGWGLEKLPEPVVDYAHQAVFVDYPGAKVPRMAIHRDGLGTVLTPPGWTLADVNKLPQVEMPMPAGDPANIPWPDGDLMQDVPWPEQVNRARLQAALDAAFTPGPQERFQTMGVVVVYKDHIIAERYAPGWGMHVPYRTWSTGKSIMSALIGILVRQGKLDIHAPAPIAAWQGRDDPRRAITIEHLLHMSSGLVSEGTRTTKAYWGGIDTAADIASKPLQVQPGTRWKYANYDTLLLTLSMKEVLGGGAAYWTFPRRELLNKIGMRDTVLEMDPYGNFIMSSQNYSTPRDLARFGLLYLHDGMWQGERILPEGWVAYTVQPAPADTQGRYGAQFWLYGRDPRLPDDVFSTAGSRGQYVTICPSHHLVVSRMGLDPLSHSTWDQAGFVATILAAMN